MCFTAFVWSHGMYFCFKIGDFNFYLLHSVNRWCNFNVCWISFYC